MYFDQATMEMGEMAMCDDCRFYGDEVGMACGMCRMGSVRSHDEVEATRFDSHCHMRPVNHCYTEDMRMTGQVMFIGPNREECVPDCMMFGMTTAHWDMRCECPMGSWPKYRDNCDHATEDCFESCECHAGSTL
jgi:hypothetical protein